MQIKSIRVYRPPKYPTLELFAQKPELLEKYFPLSWKAKELVSGALIAFVLAGSCRAKASDGDSKAQQENVRMNQDEQGDQNPQKQLAQKNVEAKVAPLFLHGEGRGAIGCIVMSPPVFMTEEEAREIIIAEFEKENITFDRNDYYVEDVNLNVNIKEDIFKEESEVIDSIRLVLDGYNTKYNIGYEFVTREDYNDLNETKNWCTVRSYNPLATAEYLRSKLQEYSKINTAIFYDPMPDAEFGFDFDEDGNIDLAEHRQKSVKKSYELLRSQVRDFIAWMKAEGLLDKLRESQKD